jgi:hypothetical protein
MPFLRTLCLCFSDLFDGTSNSVITQAIELPICFMTGEVISVPLYVTLLDSPCALVLGYNWLAHDNPSIDWATRSIKFCSTLQEMPSTPPTSAPRVETPPCMPTPSPSTTLHQSVDMAPLSIALVDVTAYIRTCKMEGSVQFSAYHIPQSANLRAASVTQDYTPDLSGVPMDYHEFADVLNKVSADGLPPHHPHDLKRKAPRLHLVLCTLFPLPSLKRSANFLTKI